MKVTENVYLLDSTALSYAYLVYTPEPVLIDTSMGFNGSRILRELSSLGVNPKDIGHILITHHDLDHIGSAALLQEATGATVWASAEDIPYIMVEKDRHSFKKYLSRIIRVKKPANLKAFSGNAINGIQILPSPGHTPGHVCFLYDGVLFAGDLLENKKGKLIPYPAAWDWDYQQMLLSIKKIASIAFTWVCPAHGKPIQRGEQLASYSV